MPDVPVRAAVGHGLLVGHAQRAGVGVAERLHGPGAQCEARQEHDEAERRAHPGERPHGQAAQQWCAHDREHEGDDDAARAVGVVGGRVQLRRVARLAHQGLEHQEARDAGVAGDEPPHASARPDQGARRAHDASIARRDSCLAPRTSGPCGCTRAHAPHLGEHPAEPAHACPSESPFTVGLKVAVGRTPAKRHDDSHASHCERAVRPSERLRHSDPRRLSLPLRNRIRLRVVFGRHIRYHRCN